MRLTPEHALARLSDGRKKAKGQKKLELVSTIGIVEEDIYLFGNADGVVVTPADSTLAPILAAWDGGADNMPQSVEYWLQEYANEIEWWQNVGEKLSAMETTAAFDNRQSIAAMIETKWSQTKPYNDMCIFEGKRCATGCNATASAQLAYYWYKKGYSRGCVATKEYKTSTNGYDVGALKAIATFNYKNMAKKPTTATQKQAIAEMMMYFGRAFHSDYTPSGTGAAPTFVAKSLRENFKMGNGISIVYASKGAATFERAVYHELLNGRPVIIAGWTGTGGGHTFVADGYDVSNNLYHVNWGWGGQCDGYFALSALNPTSSRAYNSNKIVIVGIQPDYALGDVDGDGKVDIADYTQVIQDIQNGTHNPQADINNDGKVTITDAQLIISKILGNIEL